MTVLGNSTLGDEEIRNQQVFELVVVVDGGGGVEEDFLVGRVRGKGMRASCVGLASWIERTGSLSYPGVVLLTVGSPTPDWSRKS